MCVGIDWLAGRSEATTPQGHRQIPCHFPGCWPPTRSSGRRAVVGGTGGELRAGWILDCTATAYRKGRVKKIHIVVRDEIISNICSSYREDEHSGYELVKARGSSYYSKCGVKSVMKHVEGNYTWGLIGEDITT